MLVLRGSDLEALFFEFSESSLENRLRKIVYSAFSSVGRTPDTPLEKDFLLQRKVGSHGLSVCGQ